METNQVHVAELCARLYPGFHYNVQDTDVRIECEGQKFLCHRAVLAAGSWYFKRMFNDNVWTENVAKSVVLAGDDMKAATLLEGLIYLYVGDATITSSNFLDLLRASNYLSAPGLEAHCVRAMLQSRPEPIVDLLEVLFFAHRVNNQSLIDVLATCNMTERFEKFFVTDEFLRTPAKLLGVIVSKLWRSPPSRNDVLRRAIHRWKVYTLKETEQHALELYKVLEQASEISSDHPVGSLHSLLGIGPNLNETAAATPNPSLYFYARDKNHRMKMYRYTGMNERHKKFALDQSFIHDSKIRPSRFVSVDNVGVFGMTHEPEKSFRPTFTQFASAHIRGFEHGLVLARPPVNLWRNFDLCNLSNRGLYLLRRLCPFSMPPPDTSNQKFSDDEIRRGIYFYNMELDRWYPVPAMISHPRDSCMTVLDNKVVYVIGSPSNVKMVQAYDHREGQWQRKPNVLHYHTNAQSCVLDGSIYVRSPDYSERYDPIAARWERIGGILRGNHYDVQRLIPYKHQVWQLRKLDNRRYRHSSGFKHLIEVYDPRSDSWTFMQIPGMDGPVTFSPGLMEQFVDAVTW